jgi:hypothetical protein
LPDYGQGQFSPPSGDGFRLAVTTGQRETSAQFFPAEQNILNNPAPQTVTPTATGLILEIEKDPNITANPAQLAGFWSFRAGGITRLPRFPGRLRLRSLRLRLWMR